MGEVGFGGKVEEVTEEVSESLPDMGLEVR